MFTLLTLLVACFDQLDVVQQAHLLDTVEETRERADAERQSEAFLIGVLHSILPVVARADLRLVTGLLGLLLDRTNIVLVARSGVCKWHLPSRTDSDCRLLGVGWSCSVDFAAQSSRGHETGAHKRY
jgi:hypothetical protein